MDDLLALIRRLQDRKGQLTECVQRDTSERNAGLLMRMLKELIT